MRMRRSSVCFLTNCTKALVFASLTANSPIVSTSPALSERINAGDVLTIGEFAVKEAKTKAFVQLVKKQTDERRILIVSDQFDTNTYKSARNVKPVKLATASDVNTEQLLGFEKILVTDGALAKLAERTAASGKSATGRE